MKSVRRLPRALWVLAAATTTTLASELEAADAAADGVYAHPLLDVSSEDAIEDAIRLAGSEDPERVLAELTVGVSFEEAADGTVAYTSAVWIPEREDEPEAGTPEEPEEAPIEVAPDLQEALASGAAGTRIEVGLVVRRGAMPEVTPTLGHALDRAMLDGSLLMASDAADIRAAFFEERAAATIEATAELITAVEACGGAITMQAGYAPVIQAELSIECVEAVLERGDVAWAGLVSATGTDAGYPDPTAVTGAIDGVELEDLLQTTQFYDDGFEGGGILAEIETEGDEIFRSHQGFGDYDGDSRAYNLKCVSGYFCDTSYEPSNGNAHATATASVLIGDITRGQDPNYTSSAERRQRSGVARTSNLVGVHMFGPDIDAALTREFDPSVANISAYYDGDTACAGQNADNVVFNNWYEGGIAFIKSAGNNEHSSTTDCTISSPGSAIGVFDVSAYEVDSSGSEVLFVDNSRGGTASEGRGRTIVGVTAPTNIKYAYPDFMWPHDDATGDEFEYGTEWGEGGCPCTHNATSGATPTVAGAAQVFRQWFHSAHGALVDQPGILYANLLLMGDRTAGETGALRMLTGYSNLWGAGKIRMRKWDADGLDAPARWATGHTCVSHGSSVHIDMTPAGPMDDSVDMLEAVAWWYDHRHDGGTDNDRVRLQITKHDGSYNVPVASDNSTDNKARVYLGSVTAGWDYTLDLTGMNVSSDIEGCGTNGTRVYWAYYWEDQARNDGDASTTARPQ